MSRLEIKFDNDPQTFRTFFGEEELQAENRRLYNLLLISIASITVVDRIAVIIFKNKTTVAIESIEENVFFMTISDPTIYEYEDHPKSKFSKDRILHYLDYIANIYILEEKK